MGRNALTTLNWSNANFDVKYLSTDHLKTIENGLNFIAEDLELDCRFSVFEKNGRVHIQATR
jgi:hypothetical protein